MAGWGTGSFENEHAQKWISQLHALRTDDLQSIFAHAGTSDYLEAPAASVVIAAAEVLAAANGQPGDSMPREIAAWVGPNPEPPDVKLLGISIQAVEKVRINSELRDLWMQAEGLNEWSTGLRGLVQRLLGNERGKQ